MKQQETDREAPRRAVRSPRELPREAAQPETPRQQPTSSGRPRRTAVETTSAPRKTAWESDVIRTAGGVDKIMLALVILLVCLGSVMVFSASYPYALSKYGDSLYFIKKQLRFVAVGSVFMTVAMFLPYQVYRKLSGIAYGVALVLLALVLVMGTAQGVAKRWLYIPGTSFSVQPSEIMKFAMILLLAWYLERFRDRVTARGRGHRKDMIVYGVLGPLLIIGLACGMVLLEKHLSGTAILAVLGLAVLFVGGSQFGYTMLLFGGVGATGATGFILVNPYAKKRLLDFINNTGSDVVTNDRWQTVHGLWAISSGGFLGLGLGKSRLKYQYVSQAHNDFIFTIWCEELGFVGAVFLIAVFALFIWRGYVIAMRAPDTFSSLVAFGITTQVAIQVVLNIAVVTDIIPNTGISLPFFSYGGSSLLILMAEMGVLLSISRHSYQKR